MRMPVSFADILKNTILPSNTLQIGKFYLKGKNGTESKIQYNKQDFELLEHKHEYTFPLLKGENKLCLLI